MISPIREKKRRDSKLSVIVFDKIIDRVVDRDYKWDEGSEAFKWPFLTEFAAK